MAAEKMGPVILVALIAHHIPKLTHVMALRPKHERPIILRYYFPAEFKLSFN
jgi:hypothetical protein